MRSGTRDVVPVCPELGQHEAAIKLFQQQEKSAQIQAQQHGQISTITGVDRWIEENIR